MLKVLFKLVKFLVKIIVLPMLYAKFKLYGTVNYISCKSNEIYLNG